MADLFTWSNATIKKYISPKIQAVALNPDHAILTVCVVEGKYIIGISHCIKTVGVGLGCISSVRGNRVQGGGSTSIDNAPS